MNNKLWIMSLAVIAFALCGFWLPASGTVEMAEIEEVEVEEIEAVEAEEAEAATGEVVEMDEIILEFNIMAGVDGPFLGDANPIRGINGGGAPWVLNSARGSLNADGQLEIEVEGLIIPARPGFEQFGFNPAPFFRAIVSCLTVDELGNIAIDNILTNPEDTQMIGDPINGDARISARVVLPNPCVAPIIFVTSPTGSWFASTGFWIILDE